MTDTITLPRAVIEQALEFTEFLWRDVHLNDYASEKLDVVMDTLRAALAQQAEPKCNPHPKAPHGFNRNSSHSADRYVCDCEGWDAWEAGYSEGMEAGLKIGDYMDASNELQDAMTKPQVAQQAEQGWVRVPGEPTEQMWGGLARDIVFWLYMNSGPHYGSKMHEHLRNLGTEIPDWLLKEIPDTDSTPPKGTVAVVIYKAMLAAAPKGGV